LLAVGTVAAVYQKCLLLVLLVIVPRVGTFGILLQQCLLGHFWYTAATVPTLDTAATVPTLDTAATVPTLDTAATVPTLDTAATVPTLGSR